MIHQAIIDTGVFEDGPDARSLAFVRRLLNLLVLTNLDYLTAYPDTPPLFEAGVVYERQPVWQDIHANIARGYADCKSLAAHRVADLIFRGIDQGAQLYVIRTGNHRYHVKVRRSWGWIEDPSVVLGMGQKG